MRLRTVLGLALAACSLAVVVTVPAHASLGCDRQCKIEAANSYLAALVSHDGAAVPLAENAWRQENGGAKAEGGETIRAALAHPIMYVITGIHDLRWYADGDDVLAVYYLDTVAPTYIFERFRVNDAGLITEIDAHFYIDSPGHLIGPESVTSNPDARRQALLEANHGPLGPVPVQASNTGDDDQRADSACGRGCVEAAASSFLDAMVTGVAGPFLAADATQTINHRPIANVAANLAASAGAITGVTGRIALIDGDQATVLYEIELARGGRHYGAVRFATANGVISDIEAVCAGAELCN